MNQWWIYPRLFFVRLNDNCKSEVSDGILWKFFSMKEIILIYSWRLICKWSFLWSWKYISTASCWLDQTLQSTRRRRRRNCLSTPRWQAGDWKRSRIIFHWFIFLMRIFFPRREREREEGDKNNNDEYVGSKSTN